MFFLNLHLQSLFISNTIIVLCQFKISRNVNETNLKLDVVGAELKILVRTRPRTYPIFILTKIFGKHNATWSHYHTVFCAGIFQPSVSFQVKA